jgi:hypothetical protein
VLFYGYGQCQSQSELFGLNPELYSGYLYTYWLSKETNGDQYFDSPEFKNGYAILNGKKYDNILLNLDIVNELPLLQFTQKNGFTASLILPVTQLEEFSLGNQRFRVFSSESDSVKQIYQVIGTDSIQIFYHWAKRLKTGGVSSYAENEIVYDPIKRFLLLDGKLYSYSSKSSFIKRFPKDYRPKITAFMKEIGMKKMKDSEQKLQTLIDYCNTLIQ